MTTDYIPDDLIKLHHALSEVISSNEEALGKPAWQFRKDENLVTVADILTMSQPVAKITTKTPAASAQAQGQGTSTSTTTRKRVETGPESKTGPESSESQPAPSTSGATSSSASHSKTSAKQATQAQDPRIEAPSASGEQSASDPRKKQSTYKTLQQELREEKLELQRRRLMQAEERKNRKAAREQLRREKATYKEEAKRQRRKEGLSLDKEIADALAMADITATQELEAVQAEQEEMYESSEVSSGESSFEDLEGEADFLRHLKMERSESPLRTELLTQCHGENKDSIQKVLKKLERLMKKIHRDSDLEEDEVQDVMADYYDMWSRVTHMCYKQGQYARQRKLTRANILLDLDQEIKGLLQEAIKALARRQNEKGQRLLREQRREKEHRRRMTLDPPNEPPPREEIEEGLFDNIREALNQGVRSGRSPDRKLRRRRERSPIHDPPGPPEPPVFDWGHVADSSCNPPTRDEPGCSGKRPCAGEPRTQGWTGHHREQFQNMNGNAGHPRPSSNGSFPGAGAFGGYPQRPRAYSAGDHGYTPHYLKFNGEGADFYTSLPPPWNQTPEHVPTPMSEIPQMQKAGYFIHFNGTLKQYKHFRSSMLTACHSLDVPISAKYLLMRGCLMKFNVLEELINTTCPGAEGYRQLILTLEERFGHDNLHVSFHLDRLQQAPRVRENNIEDLDELLDIVRGYEAALPPTQRRGEDPTYFSILKSKLTDRQRRDYARHVRDDGMPHSHCNTRHLMRWIKTYLAEPLRVEPPTRKASSQHETRQQDSRSVTRQRTQHSSGSGHQPGPYEGETKYQFYVSEACDVCKNMHGLESCPDFKRMPLSKKYEVLKAGGACFRCLGKNHMANECKQPTSCRKCSGTHHPLLHWERRRPDSSPRPADNSQRRVRFAAPMTGANAETLGSRNDHMPSAEELLNHAMLSSNSRDNHSSSLSNFKNNPDNKSLNKYLCVAGDQAPVSLSFQTVLAMNPVSGASQPINALVDGGAQFCAVSTRLAKNLKLEGKIAQSTVEGVGGLQTHTPSLFAQLTLVSRSKLLRQTIQVRTMEKPAGSLKASNWQHYKQFWPHLQDIHFEEPAGDGTVDLIIGANRADLITPLVVRQGSSNAPTALYTPLGWTATGPLRPEETDTVVRALCSTESDPLNPDLPDVAGMGILLNSEDRQAMRLMFTQSKQLPSGHYQVPVLWKGDQRPPNNRVEAMKEWKRNLARLKETDLHSEFDKIIKHWLEQGYVERLPSQAVLDKEAFYLPYFAVLRPDKATSKVRIVMNGKAKFGPQQISLNDCVSKGPKIINNLLEVLLRFRQYPVAISCDIQEMFLRVFMPPEDRCYHRFFYTKPEETQAGVYQANVHQFGSAGSPSSSTFPVKYHALKRATVYPKASPAMIKKTMMDDGLCPERDSEQAKVLVTEITKLLAEIGMVPHKWASNDPTVLPPGTPQRDSIDLKNPEASEWAPTDMGTTPDAYPESKALGITWSTITDELSFASIRMDLPTQWTKRAALACLMSFYSPDGLGLPLEMRGRFLFRQTWELGLDWKDALPPTFAKKWSAWFHSMGHVPFIKYPRSIGSEFKAIYIFCDASGEGYGACAYVATDLGHHLVMAKGKIVKSISQSTSVLELEGCMVGYAMITQLTKVYGLPLDKFHFFTDSTNALGWILNPGRSLPRPIARRSAILRENTILNNWHHVPGDENPADILSRGCKPATLVNNKLWWRGPEFLETGFWPPMPVKAQEHVPLPNEAELSKLVGIFISLEQGGKKLPTLFMTSHFRRGCRVMYWVRHFIEKIRRDNNLAGRSEKAGLEWWLMLDQRYHFPKLWRDMTTLGAPSQPEWQSVSVEIMGGVLTVAGRLRQVGAPLLHHDSLLAKLWLQHIHVDLLRHAGGSGTLKAESRQKMWVWKGSKLFREITSSCNHCTKKGAGQTPQMMAPLPYYRFQSTAPTAFASVGIDFAGPWWTDQGHAPGGKDIPRAARYLLVIGCLTFRAVHLEFCHGHKTMDVLLALQRFAARRRIPELIISDNAQELKKASEVLQKCRQQREDQTILMPQWGDVQWKFSHPRAPHTNGATEALVGVAKRAVQKSMPKRGLTDALLATVFTYCEDIVNRRPLTSPSNDIHDPEVLTPGHFLGTARGPLPPLEAHGKRNKFTLKWTEVALHRDNFYERFQRELVPELEKQAKWWSEKTPPEVGDVVCVLETPLTEYGHWPLGRILETYEGRDGLVRSVLVKTQGQILRRNLRHIIPLKDPRTHELANAIAEETPAPEGEPTLRFAPSDLGH